MPHVLMNHAVDPKTDIMDRLGDISDIELFHNNVIVAIYQRPNKTAGGILLTDKHLEEDYLQGKVGLVIRVGPQSFKDDSGSWTWSDIKVGDWVFFRASDGWSMSVRAKDKSEPIKCRRLKDTSIEGKISDPDLIW